MGKEKFLGVLRRVGWGSGFDGKAKRAFNPLINCIFAVHIPPAPGKEMALFLNKLASMILRKDEHKLERVALGREFLISLGKSVPIRVHQVDSLVTMLRQKLQIQRRYEHNSLACMIFTSFIEHNADLRKWEVFVNNDHTRTFMSIEVIAAGLAEITKQIQAVNEVYKLHNLPEFYKDPGPHNSEKQRPKVHHYQGTN
ncbi:hypothetical protein PRUPE_4G133000 [Prunus persica]|uniref:U6 snRNA phosphodiesterase 1 n=1 Tax=Prunus persica TaxID=3760 RepID=A0A251PK07_PRUPE|nr:hypothetical protein PRUPE_4G133000 [Prunus persica]